MIPGDPSMCLVTDVFPRLVLSAAKISLLQIQIFAPYRSKSKPCPCAYVEKSLSFPGYAALPLATVNTLNPSRPDVRLSLSAIAADTTRTAPEKSRLPKIFIIASLSMAMTWLHCILDRTRYHIPKLFAAFGRTSVVSRPVRFDRHSRGSAVFVMAVT